MAAEEPKIKLIANDGTTFDVDLDVAFKSLFIKDLCEFLGPREEVHVPEADGKTLEKIIEYCVEFRGEEYIKKRKKDRKRTELTDKHIKYFEGVSIKFVVKLMKGAFFLEIPGLVDIIVQKCTLMIKGKNPTEIRELYMLLDDPPEEQKEEIPTNNARLDM